MILGVKHDGTVSHFFHRAIKAYSTGTRKRRKIHDDDFGDVRWHKTGRTKPVVLDGVQRGCKKIMVLYGGKAVKTNWVMHQYHLGTDEDEKEGDYVVSKIFYQQPQQQVVVKQGDKAEQEVSEDIFAAMTPKADPVTPKLFTPEPRHAVRLCSDSHFADDYATPHDYVTSHCSDSHFANDYATPHDYVTAHEVSLAEVQFFLFCFLLISPCAGLVQERCDYPRWFVVDSSCVDSSATIVELVSYAANRLKKFRQNELGGIQGLG